MGSEVWAVGDVYEAYMGRWSRRVAEAFVPWADVDGGRRWLDVGCGTGALTGAVLDLGEPAACVGVDTSVAFLAHARAHARSGARSAEQQSSFCVGDARSLPFCGNTFEVIVSGVALNFVPDPLQAATEFARVATSEGVCAAYVWDYADGMAMLRHFWDAAVTLDPSAAGLDEGRRFPLCGPEPLVALWTAAGLGDVKVEAIEVPMLFADVDDYWRPFLGGQGPAPGYVAALTPARRDRLREALRARLPTAPDGSVPLTARAWAVRGVAAEDRP